jgi:hypothetical protein
MARKIFVNQDTNTIKLIPQEIKTGIDTIILTGTTTDGKPIKMLATHVSGKKSRDTMIFTIKPPESKPLRKAIKAKTTDGKEVDLEWVPVSGPDKKTNDTLKLIIPKHDTTSKIPAVDKKKILKDFFASIEKQGQSFVINNKRDTVIWGKEGTALFVPAYSFANNTSVTIIMKEYYSYQDIISNKLSTTADGRQLVTGGMLHLTAIVDGKEVDIQPNKSIRWFMPDTSIEMKNMQIFNGVATNKKPNLSTESNRLLRESDTLQILESMESINWIPQQRFFSDKYLYTSVKVLDLRDEPYKTWSTRNGPVGKFFISKDPKMSKEELKKYFIEKKGYKRVVFRERKEYKMNIFRRTFPGIDIFPRSIYWTDADDVGDSTWMDKNAALRYNLKATDTIVSRSPGFGRFEFNIVYGVKDRQKRIDTVFSNSNMTKLAERFSVDIRNLGWINCDRFYSDPRPNINYIVQLNDTASKFYTLLVFERIKSMMTGSVAGNKIIFYNVPEGETVKVVSVGVNDNGKPVAAMQSTKISRNMLEGLKFEETTPTEFKEKAGSLDKP